MRNKFEPFIKQVLTEQREERKEQERESVNEDIYKFVQRHHLFGNRSGSEASQSWRAGISYVFVVHV